MEKSNAIEIRNMSKYFKIDYNGTNTLKEKLLFWRQRNTECHQVLNNISLNIKKGETVALIGTNGSGKSTLLKLMTKIIYPNSGTIETDGKLSSLLELGAGFHPDFTGRENIYFNAAIFGLTRKEIDARVDDIIAFSELEEYIDNPIRTYSSGMYMRLAFSVAINVDAEILLIDEILAVGDQHFQDKCYEKLRELRDAGKTIVIVTHALDVVKQLCHRAIWIYKGNFQLDGDPTYVIEEYLNQVAIDHKEKRRKEFAEGDARAKGAVFIDRPKDFSKVEKNEEILYCKGWEVSDDEEGRVRILLDGKELTKVERVPRRDVYDAYFESYAGFIDEKTVGWETVIELADKAVGQHRLRAESLGKTGKILSEKEIVFEII
ncbi:ABC transporter ATP-binding protein [Claveliimonas bilis]|uniref:ABC transporter ATP-binding protein n=1 Tax=Claveliimonas bilis TaxID=3028070 RepID=UPI002930E626|nr:ABC transporter ATP-binding protein [Claveliimonas bilis]BDZ79021.1 hypothetical protein Lac3_02300 [Claveliimonas bilis]